MKVLITAGATWIKVDKVRILTNRFSGKTGLYLARQLRKKRHSVTLIINPHCVGAITDMPTVYYHYFAELKKHLCAVLKKNHYDAIIHMAAVSDYKLKRPKKNKIPSGKKGLKLELVPTEKLIKKIRALAKESLLIQFKLELNQRGLIDKAYRSLKANDSDFVVANTFRDLRRGYRSFLIDREKKATVITSKKALVEALNKIIIYNTGLRD